MPFVPILSSLRRIDSLGLAVHSSLFSLKTPLDLSYLFGLLVVELVKLIEDVLLFANVKSYRFNLVC
jgi:hypothetical protein